MKSPELISISSATLFQLPLSTYHGLNLSRYRGITRGKMLIGNSLGNTIIVFLNIGDFQKRSAIPKINEIVPF